MIMQHEITRERSLLDANGNIAPDKKNQDPRNRIDAWAAECDAFVVLKDLADEYQSMIGG